MNTIQYIWGHHQEYWYICHSLQILYLKGLGEMGIKKTLKSVVVVPNMYLILVRIDQEREVRKRWWSQRR